MKRFVSLLLIASMLSLLFVQTAFAVDPYDTNLLAYYNFDTDGSFPDESGNSHTGTVLNASYNASGLIDGRYDFNNNGRVSVAHNGTMYPGTGSYTISGWFYSTETCTYNFCANDPVVISSDYDGGTTDPGFMFGVTWASGSVYAEAGWADGSNISRTGSGGTVSRNAWTHFVSVRDVVDGEVRLYINGVKRDEKADVTSNINSFGDNALYIGANTVGMDFYFRGYIDEVGFWDRALSDGDVSVGQTAGGDVALLYNSGSGLPFQLGGVVPEFSTYGLVAVLLLAFGVVYLKMPKGKLAAK